MIKNAVYTKLLTLPVTGLVTCSSWQGHADDSYVIGEKLTAQELGKYASNNGKTVLVTQGGEVWLRVWIKEHSDEIDRVCRKYCPNGCGAFVPLSNGEKISTHNLLARFADPYHNLAIKAS